MLGNNIISFIIDSTVVQLLDILLTLRRDQGGSMSYVLSLPWIAVGKGEVLVSNGNIQGTVLYSTYTTPYTVLVNFINSSYKYRTFTYMMFNHAIKKSTVILSLLSILHDWRNNSDIDESIIMRGT